MLECESAYTGGRLAQADRIWALSIVICANNGLDFI